MSDKPMPTARDLIRALKKLPPDMPVHFMPIHSSWLGSMRPLQAFQISIWTSKGNSARKPYSKQCTAQIYVGELP
jgi:hypothetical protein